MILPLENAMEDVSHLLIEHLKAIRAENAVTKMTLDEIVMRLGRLEVGVASTHRQIAYGEETTAEHSIRFDRLVKRIERIEQRLELS
jgi:hypothetical protein